MSSSNSTILIIAGIGVGLLALLLLLGSSPEPVTPVGVVAPPVLSGEPYVPVVSASSSTPVVHAGLDRTVGERERVELSGEGFDPSGLPVTYLWTAQGGLGFFENAHSPTTIFTAPSACDCNEASFRLPSFSFKVFKPDTSAARPELSMKGTLPRSRTTRRMPLPAGCLILPNPGRPALTSSDA